jgi:hypothetical protein
MAKGDRGMKRAIFVLSGLAFTFGAWTMAWAEQIPTRADLVTLLGGPGTIEDFESYSIAPGSATFTGITDLNSSTIVNGQGPGLVKPGLDFTFGTGELQWDGAGYFGSPSKEILSGAPAGQPLTIKFTDGTVDAFGVDLRAFSGYAATADVKIYALDDTTLVGEISGVALSTDGTPVFAGWHNAGGIGEVVLSQDGQPWSPIIDNLEYGAAAPSGVPEPSSLVVFGVAGVAFAGYFAWRSRKLPVPA